MHPSVRDMEQAILSYLYGAFFVNDPANLNTFAEEKGWDISLVQKVADRMVHDRLIMGWTAGGGYRITKWGILHGEETGIIPRELCEEDLRIRTLAMEALAKEHEEKEWPTSIPYDRLAKEIGCDEIRLVQNLSVLEDIRFVESRTDGFYRITYEGLDAVKIWRQREALTEEFEQIGEMEPRRRGREFQKWFAKIVEQQGWSQEEGVRTPHEEMDVIVFRKREYYLVECKWERDPIQAPVIREVYGKMENRVEVRGIVVSMSGFTSGSEKQVKDYASKRAIFLFGPNDVRSMAYGRDTFDGLLDVKLNELTMRKEVVWS